MFDVCVFFVYGLNGFCDECDMCVGGEVGGICVVCGNCVD